MRKPWNAVNFPVYSLITWDMNGSINMNICTYVTPISMKPKKYAIGIYHNTKTLNNLQNSEIAILQFLSIQQKNLISVLGKKSGNTFNKGAYLKKNQLLKKCFQLDVLCDCFAYVLLKKANCFPAGDHDIYIFDVLKSKSQPGLDCLHFQTLIDEKLIL